MGGIGREVAARAQAFGMTIHYHNRSRLSPDLEKGAKYVSFEELIRTSDVLSLNCSLRKETVGIIGKREFEMMKQGVILINTARGRLIDEAALVEALDSGKVFSAGLDVYEEEPKVHEGLLNNPNVVLLPHIGTATFETQASREFSTLVSWLTVQPLEKHGVAGIGEHQECCGEGISDYAGSGADIERGSVVAVPCKCTTAGPPPLRIHRP
jgi:glyoxylate reductase